MINFNRTKSKNYALVQDQILALIQEHLPAGTFSESVNQHVQGCLNFTLFINKQAEVLMSHGAADKSYHWKADEAGLPLNQGKSRQHLLVPGPFLAERIIGSPLLEFTQAQVHSVGWPRLDLLCDLQARRAVTPGERKRVLWAPSHDYAKHGPEREVLSSFPAFLPFVDRLRERYDVTVSLHPRNRKNKTPTDQPLVDSDVVISDHGTMVYEAWALGKQVIFPHWLIGERMERHLPESAESLIFQRRIGAHAQSFEHLCELIDSAAAIDESARGFLDHYIDPRWAGCSGKRVAELLLQLDSGGRLT